MVAFAFIRREVDERYTPVAWIKEVTGIVLQMLVLLTIIIYAESLLLYGLG